MAGNHDKPRRVRKFIRKLRATSLKLIRRYVEWNKELLEDLKGWTRRAIDRSTVLRVTGL